MNTAHQSLKAFPETGGWRRPAAAAWSQEETGPDPEDPSADTSPAERKQ